MLEQVQVQTDSNYLLNYPWHWKRYIFIFWDTETLNSILVNLRWGLAYRLTAVVGRGFDHIGRYSLIPLCFKSNLLIDVGRRWQCHRVIFGMRARDTTHCQVVHQLNSPPSTDSHHSCTFYATWSPIISTSFWAMEKISSITCIRVA